MCYRKHRKKIKKGNQVPKNKGIFGNMSNIEKLNIESKAVADLSNVKFVNIRTIRTY